ncbi:hypothetical protein [Kitasatospora sp. NPDC059571]|uniref:hypothetical protein n=1 Tax=Kitasatospora sp. NPDC059571 TaxID=3346871 RepID=UPI0036820FC4
MIEFMDAYALWRAMPFPRGGRAGFAEIHGDLAVADEYTTTVIHFVEKGVFRPAPVDVLAYLDQLMVRIDRLAEGADADVLAAVRAYHAYAVLLRLVHETCLAEGDRARPDPAEVPAAGRCRDTHDFASRTRVAAADVVDWYSGPATVRYAGKELCVRADLVRTRSEGSVGWSGVITAREADPAFYELFDHGSPRILTADGSGRFTAVEYRAGHRSLAILGSGPAPF